MANSDPASVFLGNPGASYLDDSTQQLLADYGAAHQRIQNADLSPIFNPKHAVHSLQPYSRPGVPMASAGILGQGLAALDPAAEWLHPDLYKYQGNGVQFGPRGLRGLTPQGQQDAALFQMGKGAIATDPGALETNPVPANPSAGFFSGNGSKFNQIAAEMTGARPPVPIPGNNTSQNIQPIGLTEGATAGAQLAGMPAPAPQPKLTNFPTLLGVAQQNLNPMGGGVLMPTAMYQVGPHSYANQNAIAMNVGQRGSGPNPYNQVGP